MMKWSWAMTGVLLATGCSAGGSGGTEVSPQQTPNTLTPGGGGPPGLIVNPGVGGGGITPPEEVEPPDECDEIIPVVFRDFSDAHPDFEMEFRGDVVRRQLISPNLGQDGKPQFLSSVGCPAEPNSPMACANWTVSQPVITSATTFDQWYRTIDGTNIAFDDELALQEVTAGLYRFSSNDFFPLAPTDGFGVTPPGQGKNFLFTTEIHLNFQYNRGQRFSFQGDDDLWIFVNGRLALDLGSMHGVEAGAIDFDAQAEALGIVAGRAYPMDIFHAERHTSASNFTIETNIACFTPSDVF